MPCDETEVGEVLLSAEQIAEGVREVAAQINRDYEGREVVLVGVLTGAVVFLSDLMRQLEMPLRVDFVALASYGDHTVSSGEARLVNGAAQATWRSLGKDRVLAGQACPPRGGGHA